MNGKMDKGKTLMGISKIKNAIRLSYIISGAFVASIMILVIFATISRFTNDWTWFARSGSILVAIGVYITAYDIKGRMVEWWNVILQNDLLLNPLL